MLSTCRLHYKDDTSEMKKVEEFTKNCKSVNAVKYYTDDSFVYRLFNPGFRIENMDLIFTFRFFLIGMYKHLQQLYSNQFLSDTSYSNYRLVVYRGQRMKMIKVCHIQDNVGRLISINSGIFYYKKSCNCANLCRNDC